MESSLCSRWTLIHGLDVFNSVTSLSIMKSNQDSTDNFQEIVNRNKKVVSTENLNYLYPNGHCMTHQMRWLKVSRYRWLSSDFAV